MLIAGDVTESVDVGPFGYITSMVVTIGLWLVVGSGHGRYCRGHQMRALKGWVCRPREYQFVDYSVGNSRARRAGRESRQKSVTSMAAVGACGVSRRRAEGL